MVVLALTRGQTPGRVQSASFDVESPARVVLEHAESVQRKRAESHVPGSDPGGSRYATPAVSIAGAYEPERAALLNFARR
jgi:hypothetical protein